MTPPPASYTWHLLRGGISSLSPSQRPRPLRDVLFLLRLRLVLPSFLPEERPLASPSLRQQLRQDCVCSSFLFPSPCPSTPFPPPPTKASAPPESAQCLARAGGDRTFPADRSAFLRPTLASATASPRSLDLPHRIRRTRAPTPLGRPADADQPVKVVFGGKHSALSAVPGLVQLRPVEKSAVDSEGKMTSFVSAVVALGLASLVAGTEFASQLRKCSVDNKNALNTCLKQIMEDLRPRTKTGIPELGLPVLEPMQINNIVFRQGDGAVNVQAKFMQVKVQGLSNYTTSYVNADPQALTLSVGLMVPELRVAGLYDLKGQVIVFPVTGSGPSGLTSKPYFDLQDDKSLQTQTHSTPFLPRHPYKPLTPTPHPHKHQPPLQILTNSHSTSSQTPTPLQILTNSHSTSSQLPHHDILTNTKPHSTFSQTPTPLHILPSTSLPPHKHQPPPPSSSSTSPSSSSILTKPNSHSTSSQTPTPTPHPPLHLPPSSQTPTPTPPPSLHLPPSSSSILTNPNSHILPLHLHPSSSTSSSQTLTPTPHPHSHQLPIHHPPLHIPPSSQTPTPTPPPSILTNLNSHSTSLPSTILPSTSSLHHPPLHLPPSLPPPSSQTPNSHSASTPDNIDASTTSSQTPTPPSSQTPLHLPPSLHILPSTSLPSSTSLPTPPSSETPNPHSTNPPLHILPSTSLHLPPSTIPTNT
ncbi:hypothetical protein C7M84_022826 [Penaeus vannamei]|uniref:Uncharacterized protein n=1 Tax=Penaeus vannamei TaxID=6689 RepID=A0A3R7ND47_PENVA|nr:hypothetical protein C7M84_022826 [Penaeus vannamei]